MVDQVRLFSTLSMTFRRIAYRGPGVSNESHHNSLDAETRRHGDAAKVAAATDSLRPEVCELKPDMPIEREMAGGEAHNYRVTLSSGQYLHVVVDQRGIDVVVTVFGPDGQQIIEMDSPNDTIGPEPVSVIAEVSGTYWIEVRALEKEIAAGRYEVRIEELREPTPQDRIRIAAEKAFVEGQKLREQGTAESLRRAIEKYKESLPLWRAVGDRRGEANVLFNISFVYGHLGESQQALDYLNQALALRRAMGDRQGEAGALGNLGCAYWLLGEMQRALVPCLINS